MDHEELCLLSLIPLLNREDVDIRVLHRKLPWEDTRLELRPIKNVNKKMLIAVSIDGSSYHVYAETESPVIGTVDWVRVSPRSYIQILKIYDLWAARYD